MLRGIIACKWSLYSQFQLLELLDLADMVLWFYLPPNHFKTLFQFDQQIIYPCEVCLSHMGWWIILYCTCAFSLIWMSSFIVSKISQRLLRAPSVVKFQSQPPRRETFWRNLNLNASADWCNKTPPPPLMQQALITPGQVSSVDKAPRLCLTKLSTCWNYGALQNWIELQNIQTSCKQKKKVEALKSGSRGICRLPLWSTACFTNNFIVGLFQIKTIFWPFWWEDIVNTFNLQVSCKVMTRCWEFGWMREGFIFNPPSSLQAFRLLFLYNAVKHIWIWKNTMRAVLKEVILEACVFAILLTKLITTFEN